MIAVMFPPMTAQGRGLTEGVAERQLAKRDWTIIEIPLPDTCRSPFPEGGLLLDGAIIMAEPRDTWVNELVASGVRVVNCGTEFVGTSGVASVYFRHDDLHREVVRHFHDLGLRDAVVIGHRLDKRPGTLRVMENFAGIARAAGMKAQVWNLGGNEGPGRSPRRLLKPEDETELAAFLTSLRKPSAIYCWGDHIGFIVCEVAARLGFRVPEDLAVVGQGDCQQAIFSNPPLTSITGPAHEVGRAAADCLAKWLEDGIPPAEPVVIPGARLVARESSLGKSGDVVLESVRRFIAANAVRGVSLGELVALSGLSVKTLVRQYRDKFGIEPIDQIHSFRIAAATRMLGRTTLPVADVAAACGFSSAAGFCNYLRRQTGRSASELRKSGQPPADSTPPPGPDDAPRRSGGGLVI